LSQIIYKTYFLKVLKVFKKIPIIFYKSIMTSHENYFVSYDAI
jgi:hypothetical protein